MRNSPRPSVLFILLFLVTPLFAQYFPQSGPEALHQRALEVKARLNVLSFSLRPGYEDLPTLAYFRMEKGARIVNAFVTNGESGESDTRGLYPNQLAAALRNEAAKATEVLGGEEYFLNASDLGAARDTFSVRQRWSLDSLQQRVRQLLIAVRPDVILIAKDWGESGSSPMQEVFLDLLFRTLRKMEPTAAQKKAGGAEELFQWSVDRILIESPAKGGLRVPVDRLHSFWKKSYLKIGEEAGSAYESIAVQRSRWSNQGQAKSRVYGSLNPSRAAKWKYADDELPRPVPDNIKRLDADLAEVARATMGGHPSSAVRNNAVRRVAAAIDAVDGLLMRPLDLTSQSRKICMQWKFSLENLRVSLLGVVLKYSIDPTILTERQISFLKIDTVIGVHPGDSAWVYCPFIDQKWLIDEKPNKMVTLRYDRPYILLSPQDLDHDLPAAVEGLSQSTIGKSLTFFLLCKAKTKEESFVYRFSFRMRYSPRFSLEVLTPIVRSVDGERVIVRLTNHSRDGVEDFVSVADSLVTAEKQAFALNEKDGSQIDTLTLRWANRLEEGTYLFPINIVKQQVGRFAVRAFVANVDTKRSVALIAGMNSSPTEETLRRLGVATTVLRNGASVADQIGKYSVAIVDRRALSLISDLKSQVKTLTSYVEAGGHLIVLSQDADSWNAAPLMDGLRLTTSNAWEESTELETDTLQRVMTTPNRLNDKDWKNWLFRRAHNVLSGTALANASVPLRSQSTKLPLLAEWKVGKGTLTYCDLSLHPQFLNLLPGSFRLLANLISY